MASLSAIVTSIIISAAGSYSLSVREVYTTAWTSRGALYGFLASNLIGNSHSSESYNRT